MSADEINELIAKDLSNQFDEIIHKGLNLKGFTFFDRLELEIFIKEHCNCVDDVMNQQKTYYVKGVPFLLYNYEIKIEPFNNNKITATAGFYKYL